MLDNPRCHSSRAQRSVTTSSTTVLKPIKSKIVQTLRTQDIVNKPKAQIFPTINLIPKKLKEVQMYYRQLSHSARPSNPTVSQENLRKIKKAFEDKINEKKKQAQIMRTEESKIKWAIERQVKYKQMLQEKERVRQQLWYSQQQRKKQLELIKKKKQTQIEFFRKTRRSSSKLKLRKQKKNTEPDVKPKTARKEPQKQQRMVEQIQKLKGRLRDQYVNVISRQDALNTVLLSLTHN